MTYNGISPDCSIEEKIFWANKCCEKNNKLLFNDKKIAQLIEGFLKAASKSHEKMVEIGMVNECRKCEEDDGGACCGAGIENRYSGTLLLINLLMGVKLPSERFNSQSCWFLSKKGCSLRARHVICVNYICKKITDNIPAEKLNNLREKEGEELDILFLLNERIKAVLREIK